MFSVWGEWEMVRTVYGLLGCDMGYEIHGIWIWDVGYDGIFYKGKWRDEGVKWVVRGKEKHGISTTMTTGYCTAVTRSKPCQRKTRYSGRHSHGSKKTNEGIS